MARSLQAFGQLLKVSQSQSLVRHQSSTSSLVKTPIPLYGIDGRYASALYSAASKQNKLDVVDNDLKTLNKLLKTDVPFKDLMINPLVKINEKTKIIGNAVKLSDLTINLLTVMGENGRLRLLPKVARAFNKVMAVSRGEVECTVTTSSPVDANTRKEIEETLKGFVKGNKLLLTLKVDPSILGGMIVDFSGEHYIDMSIKSKYNMYANLLKQTI